MKKRISALVFFAALCMITALIYAITAYIVLKTSIPESFLKVGGIIGGGMGLVVSTALLTAFARIKGILSAAIMSSLIIAIKIIGNMLLGFGGYLSLNGLIGILFVIVFLKIDKPTKILIDKRMK